MWSDVGNWSRSFWRSFRWLSLPNKQNLDATKSQNSRYIEWSLYLSWSVWLLVRLTYMCSPENQCELSVLVVSHVSCFYQPCSCDCKPCGDCIPCKLRLFAMSVVVASDFSCDWHPCDHVSGYCIQCQLVLLSMYVVIASHWSCDCKPLQLWLTAMRPCEWSMSVVFVSHVSCDCKPCQWWLYII